MSCELTDVVLVVGDRSVAAHRVVLAAVSPRWKAQFCGKMAESQAVRQEVSLSACIRLSRTRYY